MNNFGSGGMFLATTAGCLFMAAAVGWPALVILLVTGIGYASFVGEANGKYNPDGSLRPRSGSERRRR